jgi:predicted acylesterase/phospholipase RssA
MMTSIAEKGLDRFTGCEKLAQGFLGGDVYRASDATLGRDVQIEHLPSGLTGYQQVHFERITAILASLHHPNIAEVYGLETTNGSLVIASELIEGETLADRLTQGLFPLDKSLSIARGIAGALHAAHEKDVVHGGLTPHSITLVRATGAVKVRDFGLAALGSAGICHVQSGSAANTSAPAVDTSRPAGTSAAAVRLPCLVLDAARRAEDKSSDVWAYGCVVFELLTGLRPFSGASPLLTPETFTRADPKWDYLPPLPAPVEALLRRCFEREPSGRPDMTEVTAVLDRALAQALPSTETGKLGLSLAGGGFRASLFHVGVLRRLAELDILRRVEVLSTVSGGSITGALYALLLKKYLEETDGAQPSRLTRNQYVDIVNKLEQVLKRGVGKDLRTRFLLNPLGNLLTIIAGDSMSRRMARMYERHLMATIVKDLKVEPPNRWLPAWFRAGQIRMRDLTIRPGGKEIPDVAKYNQKQRGTGGSVLTQLVLNATCVNSSGRFFFSAAEFGDWYLGYVREDELDDLVARKALLELDNYRLGLVAKGQSDAPARSGSWRDPTEAQRAATIAYRWKAGKQVRENPTQTHNFRPGSSGEAIENMWPSLTHLLPSRNLKHAPPGLLRKAKLAACDLLSNPVDRKRRASLLSALKEIEPDLELLVDLSQPGVFPEICDYIPQFYWMRSAERISPRIARDWNGIRLGHAVGTSACFPPVFPPFIFYGLYDDLFTTRLGLTDGGVYDNMGITALTDEGCTEIIASDTGGVFKDQPASTTNSLGLAFRIPELLTRALGGFQREHLRERRQVSKGLSDLLPKPGETASPTQAAVEEFHSAMALDSLVYFHIMSPWVMPAAPGQHDPIGPPLRPEPDPRDIARLRTDLDGFGETEIAALVNHGYDIADRHVRRYAPALVRDSLNGQPPCAPSRPWSDVSPEWAHRMLAVGSERFFRALRVGSAVSWFGTILMAMLVIGAAWMAGLTIDRVFGAAASVARNEMARFDWALRSPVVLLVLLVGSIVLALWRVSRIPRRNSIAAGPHLKLTRALKCIFKYVRAAKGNLLWGLFGLPIILALSISAVALFSYAFFHLPYMRATRLARAQLVDDPHRTDHPNDNKRPGGFPAL